MTQPIQPVFILPWLTLSWRGCLGRRCSATILDGTLQPVILSWSHCQFLAGQYILSVPFIVGSRLWPANNLVLVDNIQSRTLYYLSRSSLSQRHFSSSGTVHNPIALDLVILEAGSARLLCGLDFCSGPSCTWVI